jgi:hypothetical protein
MDLSMEMKPEQGVGLFVRASKAYKAIAGRSMHGAVARVEVAA